MLYWLRRHIKLLLIAVVLLTVVVSGVFIYKTSVIKKIKVTGNHFYSEEEIQNLVFDSAMSNNTFACYLKNHFGKNKEIPFIERYQIDILNRNEVELIIYEKNIVGFVKYMGSYMYFDRDGVVVESSDEKLDGICELKGITFSKIVLHEPLETDIDDLFDNVLLMTQTFEKLNLDIESITFDKKNEINLKVNDIKVILGKAENLDLKLSELNDILPHLKGMKGTLYLDNEEYGAASDGIYSFIKGK